MTDTLPILARIAKEAGDTIKQMQQTIVENKDGLQWHTKPDGSPVSKADEKAHEIVVARLKEYYPDIPVVSEEADKKDNKKALQSKERFDTDPLDITSGYVTGKDGWSVYIGRIKDGVPTDGAIYFPVKQELYFTGNDGKAYLQKGDAPPQEIHVKSLGDPIAVAAGFNESNLEHLGGKPSDVKNYGGQYRTCMVATGDSDITGINNGFGGGFESWDTAGPHAVLRRAGGDIVTMEGKPLRYGPKTQLPSHVAGSIEALKALGLYREAEHAAPEARLSQIPMMLEYFGITDSAIIGEIGKIAREKKIFFGDAAIEYSNNLVAQGKEPILTQGNRDALLRLKATEMVATAAQDIESLVRHEKKHQTHDLPFIWGNSQVNTSTVAKPSDIITNGVSALAQVSQNIALLTNEKPELALELQPALYASADLMAAINAKNVVSPQKMQTWKERLERGLRTAVEKTGHIPKSYGGDVINLDDYISARFGDVQKAISQTVEKGKWTSGMQANSQQLPEWRKL